MPSYFVAYHAPPAADVAVHDRSRCPPDCFLGEALTEYLGEFLDGKQAVAVARLRYAHAHGCTACEPARARVSLATAVARPTASA
ncbi:hypothetical protein [Ramlibacter sp. AN1133]|uniref:hypothetical protein n=1 Tax=Ramlibacter sp. AN1133 TaxID=3133429 RepID=UPI0030BD2664